MTQLQVNVDSILKDIENGLSRPEIKKKYGYTGKQMSVIFKHPRLKNRRAASKPLEIVFIEEGSETIQEILPNDVSGTDVANDVIAPIEEEYGQSSANDSRRPFDWTSETKVEEERQDEGRQDEKVTPEIPLSDTEKNTTKEVEDLF